jgi:signal transduction histidine kinase
MDWQPELHCLLDEWHRFVIEALPVRSSAVALIRNRSSQIELLRMFPPTQTEPAPSDLEQLVKALRAESCDLITPESHAPLESEQRQNLRRKLESLGFQTCLRLEYRRQFLGVMLLAHPQSPLNDKVVSLVRFSIRLLSVVVYKFKETRSLDLVGHLSNGLAHDLENLLIPLSVFLQYCRASNQTTPQHQELVSLAIKNLEMIQACVERARYYSGHRQPYREQVHLEALLGQAVELIRPKAANKNIRVLLEAPTRTVMLADGVLMHRLILNLLSNAIEASPVGAEVLIQLHHVRPSHRQSAIRIRIIDQGVGMNPVTLHESIVPAAVESSKEGLGLGICREIVELHDGQISFSSTPGKGTVVEVHLPHFSAKSL